jgi:FKBP-type peptidyl-prolyl cis-trans isomerase FkpA
MMKRSMITAVLALSLAACGTGEPDTEPRLGTGDPADERYAESLGVSLDGMTRSSSGLYMEDLEVGTGATATAGNTVVVHYTGWLPDGSEFDSSRTRNQPFSFQLGEGQVIRGWDEGVEGMRVGGRRKLVIPSDLAYGPDGFTGAIPPRAVLVFDVELLEVQ